MLQKKPPAEHVAIEPIDLTCRKYTVRHPPPDGLSFAAEAVSVFNRADFQGDRCQSDNFAYCCTWGTESDGELLRSSSRLRFVAKLTEREYHHHYHFNAGRKALPMTPEPAGSEALLGVEKPIQMLCVS